MPPSHLSPMVSEEAPRSEARGPFPWAAASPPAPEVVDALAPDVFAAWGLGPGDFAVYAAPVARAPDPAPPSVDDGAWEGAQSLLLAGSMAPPRGRRPGG